MKSLAIVALLAAAAAPVAAQVTSINFLAERTLATGLQYGGTTTGGISGLAYDASTGRYVGLSDDRSQLNPARFYDLDISYAAGSLNVGFSGVTTLRRADGIAYPTLSLDPEGIALANGNRIVVTSEGDTANGIAPFISTYDRTSGQLVSSFNVANRYIPDGTTPATQTRGVRNNLAFESMTRTPDASSYFSATENALAQDGPTATPTNGTNNRIMRFDAAGNRTGEFVYVADPVVAAPIPSNQFFTSGLVEMLALDNNHLIVMERSFSIGVGFAVKLYEVTLDGATDVTSIDSVANLSGITTVSKRLILDLGTLGLTLDNLEALALGPTLPSGGQLLIIASDNNFSSAQVQQFLAFDLATVPTPGAAGLLALGGLVATRRRR